jgi:hypothetical protein
MNYLKIALYVGLFAIGFGVAWSWQGARLDVCKKDNQVCVQANAENVATIDALKAEIAKGNKACEARLKSKDKALKRIQEIDKMRGKDEKNPDSGNPLRDALNGMFGDN